MDNKVKNVLLIVLIIGLVGMTSAYALLSQNLEISSTAEVVGSNWDIHFESLTQDDQSTGTVATPAELDSSTVISGLKASFKLPGEYVAYTFDISNAGDIEAIIESVSEPTITCTPEGADATLVCENVTYSLTYTSDTTEEPFVTKVCTLSVACNISSLLEAISETPCLRPSIEFIDDSICFTCCSLATICSSADFATI